MAKDKLVSKYLENNKYGKDSLSHEIHGNANKTRIEDVVVDLVAKYDQSMANKDTANASKYRGLVHGLAMQCDLLKGVKEEWAMNIGGGVAGNKLFSNYTNLTFPNKFFTEQGEILFDEEGKFLLAVKDDEGNDIVKRQEDLTEDWIIRSTEENDFMKRQQSCVKQQGKPLDFDIDWEVSKMLRTNEQWKSMATDSIGGVYFVNKYIEENAEAMKSGMIPDEKLHPDSFDPEFDNRLHAFYADRLRKAHDPNYQTPADIRKTDQLIAQATNQTSQS
jgi:hypothetical protein